MAGAPIGTLSQLQAALFRPGGGWLRREGVIRI